MEKLTVHVFYTKSHSSKIRLPFCLSLLALLLSSPHRVYAEDYFDPLLLNLPQGTDPGKVDLSAFSQSEYIPSGRYMVALVINQQDAGNQEITFSSAGKKENAVPDVTPALLRKLGVNVDAIPSLNSLPADAPLKALDKYIPDAKVTFDIARLRLTFSVPQVAMKPDSRGYVDPSLLDQGIPALLLNYQINGGKQWSAGQQGAANTQSNNYFASVRGGLNLGAWRLRSNMTYNHFVTQVQSQGKTYRTNDTHFSNTSLMRDIQPWNSEILLGESSTRNDVLDSIPFKGVRIGSNEQMLPSSLRGFAPEINGIAQTNARITVRQNGNIVYQTYVAPGPFSIRDLFPAGTAGDLDVSIAESDGTVRTFTQAFSTLPVMLRSGGIKYEMTAGRYNGGITVGSNEADFVQGTLIYGLPHAMTLYGGGIVAKDYWSGTVGTGISLGAFGALSTDITYASATLNHQSNVGQSYRVRYSKSLLTTGTSVDLTALRYSTKDYYSFADFNNSGFSVRDDVSPWLNDRQRNSFQTAINQSLGEWGSINLQGSRSDYWEKNQTITSLSMGYNNSVKQVNFGINYSISRTQGEGDWPENRQIMVNFNLPFSAFSHNANWSTVSSNTQISHDNQGRSTQQVGISGHLLDNKFNYSLTQSHDNQDQGNNGTANLAYQGGYGDFGGGYSYSRQAQAVNLNANGGIVVHSGGVTLSRYLGNSVALVEAPNAEGTTLSNGDTPVDRFGYAVSPYMTDYSKNTVSLNLNTLPDNVMPDNTSVNVYPTKGAVVKARFLTRKGYQALINLQASPAIPLGAIASLKDLASPGEINSNIVGENGQVYFSGLPERGEITVTWGRDTAQSCVARFDLTKVPESPFSSIRQMTALCHSSRPAYAKEENNL
ncbi:fimbrial biogenesis outer membrane usher protein [Serratia fonticola]|uniref:fimbria/pilus outer membrane usher protein n=1 Tax=Serratia fonticola TaxID=47917 RepID=UPI0015C5C1E7|nr:fimbria/pilus outer membrane usher protein [Serratia fonticola]NYA46067.1 fimbrial biogenesis outer membrane usher protein [Serratia fonticola]